MVGKLTLVALIIQTSLMMAYALKKIDFVGFLVGTLGDLVGLTIAYKILSRR